MICMHGSIRVYTNVKLVLPNPPTFVGWGIREPGLILYTSHLLASFNLGRPQRSLMEERVAWMLEWQAVGQFHFLSIECTGGLVLVSK